MLFQRWSGCRELSSVKSQIERTQLLPMNTGEIEPIRSKKHLSSVCWALPLILAVMSYLDLLLETILL
jgi:hypothetical protein